MILILDYGFGNKKNISNALSQIDIPNIVSNDPKLIFKSSHLIFPGVGSFGAAMKIIKKKKILDAIHKANKDQKKMLGICLGMQLFFEKSEETRGIDGLKFLKGEVVKIKKSKIVPHIGWNKIKFKKKDKIRHSYFDEKFYFLHSYVINEKKSYTQAEVKIENTFVPAIVSDKNILGVQFHPERSGIQGLNFLKDFYNNNLL